MLVEIPVLKKKQKKSAAMACLFIGMAAMLKVILYDEPVEKMKPVAMDEVNAETAVLENNLINAIRKHVLSIGSPAFSFAAKENAKDAGNFLEEVLISELPFIDYLYEEGTGILNENENYAWQQSDKGQPGVGDEESPVIGQVAESMTDEESQLSNQEADDIVKEDDMPDADYGENDEYSVSGNTLAENFRLENENAIKQQTQTTEFVPHERQLVLNMEDYKEFSALFDAFYAMDSNTMVGRDELNVDTLLEKDVTIDKTAQGPHILIYHTHSQEAFADSIPGDKSTTIMGAGEKLAKLLSEKYGYSVLHHTGEYDVGDRDNAYSKSLPALEQLLAENPGIQVIIDLHRDGVAEDRKLAVDLDGRPTAQFMLFNGLSRTKNTGDIDYLYNPYQADNLALSFQTQLTVDEYYPGLARRIYLNGYRYNMHLRPSLLVELGAQTNTVEEIMNAIDPLAHVLDLVLSGKVPRQSNVGQ